MTLAPRLVAIAAAAMLPGCAADGSFDAGGFASVIGAVSGAVSDYRRQPPDGPDTARTGYYDSDGIWRTNF